jgi:protoheme IX farnesyltransferase
LSRSNAYAASLSPVARIREYAVLFKLRLASLVVVSAVLGYLLGVPAGEFSWVSLIVLILGGTLLTGASNALNQVLEVREDGLMSRTADRPLVRGSLAVPEAVVVAFVAGATGVFLLWSMFGPLTGILGFLSLFMYVALYTPMKKHSPWAVFVGAFPGAFPPMLGYVAATGHFDLGPGLVFATQFMWQFPHFWAIAWVLDDDYRKAGYFLLPSRNGRDRSSAFLILLYSFFVIPVGMLPWVFGLTGELSMVVAILAGIMMLIPAWKLLFSHDKADARKLMFASFIYLPVVQLAYVLDRL